MHECRFFWSDQEQRDQIDRRQALLHKKVSGYKEGTYIHLTLDKEWQRLRMDEVQVINLLNVREELICRGHVCTVHGNRIIVYTDAKVDVKQVWFVTLERYMYHEEQ